MLLSDENWKIGGGVYKSIAELFLMGKDKNKELKNVSFSKDPKETITKFLSSRDLGEDPEKFWNRMNEFLITNGVTGIIKEYCNTDYMKSKLASDLGKYLRERSQADSNIIGIVLGEFMTYWKVKSSSRIEWDAGTCADMIRSSFSLFCKEHKDFIYGVVNEKGTNITLNSGEERSLSNAVVSSYYDVEIGALNFRESIKNIYIGSKQLFPAGSGGQEGIYQDLVSLCIILEDSKNTEELDVKIGKSFYSSANKNKKSSFLESSVYLPRMQVIDTNMSVGGPYKIASYALRRSICEIILEGLDNGTIDGSQVDYLFNSTWTIDNNELNNKNISRVYSKCKTRLEGKAIFMKILYGLISANNLLNYCREKGINYRDIPVDVFRTDLYGRRFNTLEDCLAGYGETKRHINNSSRQHTENLVYADILHGSLVNLGSGHNFSSIISLIENAEGKGAKINIDSSYLHYEKLRVFLKAELNVLFKSFCDKYGDRLFKSDKEVVAESENSQEPVSKFKVTIKDISANVKTIASIIRNKELADLFTHISKSPFTSYDIPTSIMRSALMKYSIVCQLAYNYKCFSESRNNPNFDLLSRAVEGKLNLFPDKIDSEEDLVVIGAEETTNSKESFMYELNSSGIDVKDEYLKCAEHPNEYVSSHLETLVPGGLDQKSKIALSHIYSCFRNGFDNKGTYSENMIKASMEHSNRLIQDFITESEDNGVTVGLGLSLTRELQMASLECEDRERVTTKSFERFSSRCEEVKGYLYLNGRPVRYERYYVHRTGWFVKPNGEISELHVTENLDIDKLKTKVVD